MHYHLGKAGVAANALSCKAHCNCLPVVPLTGEESSIQVLLDLSLFNITLTPILKDKIIATQKNDEGMTHIRRRVQEGESKVNYFLEDAEGTLWFKDRLVVRKREALKKKILDEALISRFPIHPGRTKIYHDLRQQFWWTRMKCEIAHYLSGCNACRKVKADYIDPSGLLQPLSIPDWKWDDISMDFIVGLSLTTRNFNSIWLIMDRLTKSYHFILINTNYNTQKYAKIHIACVLCLHGLPKMIVCDRGSQFVAHFWEQLHVSLMTHLIHSSAYHLQMDGQTKQVNQKLEDMLRACVMENHGSWDKNLNLAEFSYNNNYQAIPKMAPFEVLYERRCHTPHN
jgi:hypothetical protein